MIITNTLVLHNLDFDKVDFDKVDFDAKMQNLNKTVTSNKTKHMLVENEF